MKDQDKTNSSTQSWGYGTPPKTEKEFLERLEGQMNGILELKDQVWGYCYTQLTDVEQEQNGIYYYDRTPKFDTKLIHSIFSKNPEDLEAWKIAMSKSFFVFGLQQRIHSMEKEAMMDSLRNL